MPNETLSVATPPVQGEAVCAVQDRLIAHGHSPGARDCVYGEMTANAVRAFQRDHGLAADGVVGPETRRALDAAPSATPGPTPPPPPPGAPPIVTARSIGLAFANLFGGLGPELHLTGHYSAGPRAANADEGIARTREFHDLHRGPARGWGGIAYHYLIPDDGTLIGARPTSLKGAHVGRHNSNNIGVNMPGTVGDRPTEAQAATYRWLLENAHTDRMPAPHRTDRDLRQARRRGHKQWPGHETNGCPGLFLDMYVRGG